MSEPKETKKMEIRESTETMNTMNSNQSLQPKTCWTRPMQMNLANGGRKASYRKMASSELFEAEEYNGNLARYRYRIMFKFKKYSTYRVAATDDLNAFENTWNYAVYTIPTLIPPVFKKESEIFAWLCNHIENLYTIQSTTGMSQRRDESASPKSSILLDTFFTNSDSEMEDETSDEDEELELKDFEGSPFIQRKEKEESQSPEKEFNTLSHSDGFNPTKVHSSSNVLSKSAKLRLRKGDGKGLVDEDENAVRANSSEPNLKKGGWFKNSPKPMRASLFGSPLKEEKKEKKKSPDEKKEELFKSSSDIKFSQTVNKYFRPSVANYLIEYRKWFKQIFHEDATRDERTTRYTLLFITVLTIHCFILRFCSFDLFLVLMFVHAYGIRHLIKERRKYMMMLAKRKLKKTVQQERRKWYSWFGFSAANMSTENITVTAAQVVTKDDNKETEITVVEVASSESKPDPKVEEIPMTTFPTGIKN